MEFITSILTDIGVDTSMGLLAFLMIVLASVGRAIPDDATGVMGIIRKIAKVAALKGSDRKSSDDSVG